MALSLLPSALSFTAPATAFRSGSPSMSVLKGQPFCKGLPGAISPLGEFDPLGFSNDVDVLEVNRLREAELAHGRVGMLAAAGFLVQEKFHPLFGADGARPPRLHSAPVSAPPPPLPTPDSTPSPARSLTPAGGPAIDQIPALPPVLWFGLTVAIAAAETLRIQKGWANPYDTAPTARFTNFPSEDSNFQQLKPDYVPGDLGFDPLGLAPDDADDFRAMQEKELSNGRLGMIAAAGFLAQEAVTGSTWGTYWGLPDF